MIRQNADNDSIVVSRILSTGDGQVVGALSAEDITDPEDPDGPIRDIAWRSPTSIAVLQPVTHELFQVRTWSVDGAGTADPPSVIPEQVVGLIGTPVDGEPIYALIKTESRTALADLAGPRGERLRDRSPADRAGLRQLTRSDSSRRRGHHRYPDHVEADLLERALRLASRRAGGQHVVTDHHPSVGTAAQQPPDRGATGVHRPSEVDCSLAGVEPGLVCDACPESQQPTRLDIETSTLELSSGPHGDRVGRVVATRARTVRDRRRDGHQHHRAAAGQLARHRGRQEPGEGHRQP